MKEHTSDSSAETDAEDSAALVTAPETVEEIAGEIASEGRFAFDLEFVSEGRYLPDLALIQVAWGEPLDPNIALIDCVAVDPMPILKLVADEVTATIAHAAKQDLGLLASRFSVAAHRLWDTQIAAAFLGIGDQIGYAKLVSKLIGEKLDKGAQYTEWLKRPLSTKQILYAGNDVRYLLPVWDLLQQRLEESGRLSWVAEESEGLARSMEKLPVPDEVYRELRGWHTLEPGGVGSLRMLAAWRERTARSKNRPLSWLIPDRAMVDLCRLVPRDLHDLKRVRGIGNGTVRRYGEEMLDHIREGAASPIQPPTKTRPLTSRGQVWATTVANLIQSKCLTEKIAPRFVATRANAEALVAWFENGDRSVEPDIPLLHGWRREMVGEAALAWLGGDATISVDRDGPAALRLEER